MSKVNFQIFEKINKKRENERKKAFVCFYAIFKPKSSLIYIEKNDIIKEEILLNIVDINKTPQNDFVFKQIFAKEGNEDMLQELLEDLLEIKIRKIKILRQAVLEKETKENKESIIDLKATVDDDKVIDIEMQVRNEYNIVNRSLFAGAALFHNSLKKGANYNNNKTAIVICILSYDLFNGKNYLVSGRMRRDDNYEVITDKIQLYYLQLPKFLKQKEKKKNKLAQWLYFISQQDKEGLSMAIEENDKVAKAQKQLEEILSDDGIVEVLEMRLKTKLDKNTALDNAKKQGLEQGLEQGLKEGKKETAKNMLKKGFSINDIIEITGLTEEEILK